MLAGTIPTHWKCHNIYKSNKYFSTPCYFLDGKKLTVQLPPVMQGLACMILPATGASRGVPRWDKHQRVSPGPIPGHCPVTHIEHMDLPATTRASKGVAGNAAFELDP